MQNRHKIAKIRIFKLSVRKVPSRQKIKGAFGFATKCKKIKEGWMTI
jgi:hypothetical protein